MGQDPSQQPAAATASSHTASPDMDSLLQAEIAREESTGLLDYAHSMEQKRDRHHNTDELSHRSNGGLPQYDEPSKGFSLIRQGYSALLRAANVSSSPLSTGSQASQKSERTAIKYTLPLPSPPPPARIQYPGNGGQPVPLIDTLPKAKQRQIFGLVSGIQGGIDHLQTQLNILQTSLGIDLEDFKAEKAM